MHQLVPDMAGSEAHPEWSADGSQIAFVHGALDGTTELMVIDADGTHLHTIYTCERPCNEISYPDWAPDGDAIFFSQSADAPAGGDPRTFRIGRIMVANRRVDFVRTRDDGLEMWQARVSPDGTTIAYEAGSEELGAAIFTALVAGGDEFQVTDWELMGAHPDWTADGRIVFHQWDLAIFPTLDQAANMYLVDADGNHLEPLTHFTEIGLRAAQTRVAPDGSGVVFTRVEGPDWGHRRLAFLAFGDTEPGWLTPNPIDATHPSLRPAG
jgi:Tol biopolymer transport system component